MKSLALWAWILGVLVLIGLSRLYHGETSSFHGIAEAAETSVSVEYSVEILEVRVVPGQEVKAGDTLLRLARPELTLRISELTRELQGLEGKNSVSNSELDRRVAEVRAAQESRRNQLQFEISNLQDERKRNQDLTAKLQSLPKNSAPADTASDAMLMRIHALQRELAMAERLRELAK